MEEKKVLTYEEIMTMIAETNRMLSETNKRQEERDRELAKLEKYVYAVNSSVEGMKKNSGDLEKYVYAVNSSVEGMKKNSGDLAEDYFYNSLNATKTLGGVHFDAVKKNLKGSIPLEDGKTLDGEYDITLINKDSLGMVEVKYTVEKEDVEKLVKEQVKSFKALFPMYANYKFYLGIGGMSFDKQAEDAAKKLGVGILKLNGDAVEIDDKNLKVY